MIFLLHLLALLFLLCDTSFADVKFTSAPVSVEKGKSYTIRWQGNGTEQYKIVLRKGPSTNLGTVGTLTTLPSTSQTFTWTPSTTLQDGSDYALQIIQGTSNSDSGPLNIMSGSRGGGAAGTISTTPTITTTPTTTKGNTTPAKETTSTTSTIALPATLLRVVTSTSKASDLVPTMEKSDTTTSQAINTTSLATVSETTLKTLSKPSTTSPLVDAASSSSTNPASSPSATPKETFSTGYKTSIGVGVAMGVMILAWTGFWIGKYTKKTIVKRAGSESPVSELDASSWRGAEIDGAAWQGVEKATKLHAAELEGRDVGMKAELP